MTLETPVVVAILAVTGTLLGAEWGRRTKRLEFVYAKKADAYRAYLEQAGLISHTTDTNEKYPEYLQVLLTTRLVASPAVEKALMDNQRINWAIQKLRSGDPKEFGRRERIRSDDIHPAMERVIREMSKDLQRFCK